MQKLQQIMVLTLVVIVAIVAGGYFLLISPQHSKAAAIRDQVAGEQTTTTQLQGQIQQYKQEQLELPSVQAALAKIARMMPSDPGEPSLVRQLSEAAISSGVDLQVLDPGQPTADTASGTSGVQGAKGVSTSAPKVGSYLAIPVKLTAVGTYPQLQLFIHSLEHLSRAMRVGSISLAPGDPLGGAKDASTPGAPGAANPAPATSDVDKLTAQINATVFMVPATAAPSAQLSGPTASK